LLFHNDGTGHFTEVSQKAGVSDPRGYFGLGIAWFDYNDDGYPDLYVANDSTANFLYVNQKDGTFKEQAFPLGVAVSEDGAEQGSMGVALGDYDHSGRFSIFVTNFSEEYNAFYHHDGDHFTDVSFKSRTAPSSLPYVGWGDAFLDYDNDGWPDIIVVNGHVYPQLDKVKLGASAGYRQRKLLYHNRGDGGFDEVAAKYGSVLTDERVSRGLAVGDIDDDGGVDVVNQRSRRLAAAPPKRTGGARRLADGESEGDSAEHRRHRRRDHPSPRAALRQRAVVQSGTSYLSQNDMRQHFGLGTGKTVDSVEVLWPDGMTSVQNNVTPNQVLVIRQPSKRGPIGLVRGALSQFAPRQQRELLLLQEVAELLAS